MMNGVKILRGIGEFPQCLLGYILIHIYKVEYDHTYRGIDIYSGDFPGGISLGLYILLKKRYSKNSKNHEWGHTIQSLRWGGLYLPTVGLVSITWCGLRNISKKLRSKGYYSIWPENKADKLGKVKRK